MHDPLPGWALTPVHTPYRHPRPPFPPPFTPCSLNPCSQVTHDRTAPQLPHTHGRPSIQMSTRPSSAILPLLPLSLFPGNLFLDPQLLVRSPAAALPLPLHNTYTQIHPTLRTLLPGTA